MNDINQVKDFIDALVNNMINEVLKDESERVKDISKQLSR